MKIIDCNRRDFYQIISICFEHLGISPEIIEVGVNKGDNAEQIHKILKPSLLYLLDSWSAKHSSNYNSINKHRFWVDKPEKYDYYFGGSVYEQSTFDSIFISLVEKFKSESRYDNIKILRNTSLEGAAILKSVNQYFDLIYLDASHQYEDVYDDLKFFSPLLRNQLSLIQLNDCCHSEAGIRQNLGVLEACVRFCKEDDFIPLMLTNNDWTDVLLCKKGSGLEKLIDIAIIQNGISFVEVPHQLLGALTIRGESRKCISFI
jgi:hypothetical protein